MLFPVPCPRQSHDFARASSVFVGTEGLLSYLAILSSGLFSATTKATSSKRTGRRKGRGAAPKKEPAPTAADLDVEMDNWAATATNGNAPVANTSTTTTV
jgi:hypothetical protein